MASKIRIDLSSSVPATRQIADALRVELVEGRLQPGDELPSVRRAAIDLGLHFNTVAEAYRQLAAEGWLDLRHGRSARVADRRQPTASHKTVSRNFSHRMKIGSRFWPTKLDFVGVG